MKDKFIKLRESSGLNQKQIADYLGIDQSYISKIENGERVLTLEIAEKMALLSGYDLSYFYSENEIEPLKFSLRSNVLNGEDLKHIAEINKIAINLREINSLESNYE